MEEARERLKIKWCDKSLKNMAYANLISIPPTALKTVQNQFKTPETKILLFS